MKNNNELIKKWESILEDTTKKSGAILYSTLETLKKGDIYLLGYNPGGESTSNDTIENHLKELKDRNTSAYLEQWGKK